jgi:hypothetical protein
MGFKLEAGTESTFLTAIYFRCRVFLAIVWLGDWDEVDVVAALTDVSGRVEP